MADYWRSEKIADAIKALEAAHKLLNVSYPYSPRNPNAEFIPNVRHLLRTAEALIAQADPDTDKKAKPNGY